MDRLSDLTERVRAGHAPSMARMISLIESGRDGIDECVAQLHAAGGHAHIVGITGPAGSGKSTLVAALTRELRARDISVGVVAVDPTSAFSGGSILGDRIRMGEMSSDPRVFFRSMATRGALGGLSGATSDAVAVLDAARTDYVLVETVGAGQVEVDIATASHTTVVVSVPGLGDEIQTIKAGLLEIADIHVVNKADLDGANKAIGELKSMLKMSGPEESRKPRVLPVTASSGAGVVELVEALEDHRRWLEESGELERRERDMATMRVKTIVQGLVLRRMQDPSTDADFAAVIEKVRERQLDPMSAARQLIQRTL